MQAIFPLAGAVLVFLEVLGALLNNPERIPLGGSHIAQVAVVLGSAFVIYEIVSVLRYDRSK